MSIGWLMWMSSFAPNGASLAGVRLRDTVRGKIAMTNLCVEQLARLSSEAQSLPRVSVGRPACYLPRLLGSFEDFEGSDREGAMLPNRTTG
jgi:hypothetical protein